MGKCGSHNQIGEKMEKRVIDPLRIRKIQGSFAFIEHRFLQGGFWSGLNHHELLLYLFLILAADRNGVSYYGYDKICAFLQITQSEYVAARNAIIEKNLIAYDGGHYQVLSLPEQPVRRRS
jgi:hypothetical protein